MQKGISVDRGLAMSYMYACTFRIMVEDKQHNAERLDETDPTNAIQIFWINKIHALIEKYQPDVQHFYGDDF